jgi:hypothetical protein
MLKRILIGAALAVTLASCAGRFVGPGVCSQDGSVVWFERPNSQGSYEGLNNSPQNCRR